MGNSQVEKIFRVGYYCNCVLLHGIATSNLEGKWNVEWSIKVGRSCYYYGFCVVRRDITALESVKRRFKKLIL